MNAGIKKYQEITHVDQESMDDKHREELIIKYAPLVKQIAERMAVRLPPNISKEELIGPGVLGLFDAIDKFDSTRGIKFRTYANLRIKGAILDELRKMDWISRSVRRNINRIEDAIRTLEMKLGNETYLLNEGDSIYYPTNIPHSWKALNSESIEVIWVVTPPSF